MKCFFLIALLVFVNLSFASDIYEQYKINYIIEMRPVLKLDIMEKYPKTNIATIAKSVDALLAKTADCQYSSTEHYLPKYRALAIEPLARGISMDEMLNKFAKVVQDDVAKGILAQSQLDDMISIASEKLILCIESKWTDTDKSE